MKDNLIEQKIKELNINAGKILYNFNYNISRENKYTDGECVLYENYICACDNSNSEVRVFELDKIERVKCVTQVGSISLEFKYDGEQIELCRANMKFKNALPDFAMQFDLLIKERKNVGTTVGRPQNNENNVGDVAHGVPNKNENNIKMREIKDNSEKNVCPKCGGYLESSTGFCAMCASKFKTIGRVFGLIGEHKIYLISAVLIFFAITSLDLFIPFIQRNLVDNYITASEEIRAGIKFTQILLIVGSLAGIELLNRGFWALRGNILSQMSAEIAFKLRNKVFAKIQELSIAKQSRRTSGELINRVVSDTNDLQDFLTWGLPDVAQQIVMLLAVSVVILMRPDGLLILAIVIVPVPIFLLINTIAGNVLSKYFEKAWRMRSKSNSILHDIFSGMKVVKSYGTEQYEIERSSNASKDLALTDMRAEQIWNLIAPFANFVLRAGTYFFLMYAGNKIIGGNMTLGEMSQYTAYMNMLYGPFQWMGNLPRWLEHIIISASKIFDVLDEKPDVKNQENAITKDIKGFININSAFFGYKDYDPVLKDINMQVQPGEMIGIVGKSGVGKSTLINLLMRLYDVNSGEILVDGVNIKDYDQNNLRSQIGAVLQETFLFAGTIYENIAYAKPNATREEIIAAAKFANAHQFIIKLPDGYNTKVGEHGHTLSGGERQRVAIARAVLHDPKILILDEATSALDTETEALVQEALEKLTKNRTTFAIAHRLATLRHATRLIILDKGAIAESGTHDELMLRKGIYYNLVMAQRQMSKMNKVKK